jgi:hypothetical protein
MIRLKERRCRRQDSGKKEGERSRDRETRGG